MDGTASYGSGTDYARANHVHPTDTSRAEQNAIETAKVSTSIVSTWITPGSTLHTILNGLNSDKAASTHAHGNITSGGDITATAPTITSGDCLVINDDSASKITNGPSFGTSTTTYLRNDGT